MQDSFYLFFTNPHFFQFIICLRHSTPELFLINIRILDLFNNLYDSVLFFLRKANSCSTLRSLDQRSDLIIWNILFCCLIFTYIMISTTLSGSDTRESISLSEIISCTDSEVSAAIAGTAGVVHVIAAAIISIPAFLFSWFNYLHTFASQ